MRSLIAVLLLLSGLASAGAEDRAPTVPSPLPVIPANPDWSGIYAGARAGMAFHSVNYDFSTTFAGTLDSHTRIGELHDGPTLGFYGGYNLQLPGPFVVGVEGETTFLKARYQLNGPTVDFLQKSKRISTVAGRFGVLFTPTTMSYVKYGTSRINVSGVQGFAGIPFNKDLDGKTYGVGIESMLTENLLIRIEAEKTKATEDLILNSGFDHYRPEFFQVMGGAALKFDPLGSFAGTRTTWLPMLPPVDRTWTSVFVGADMGKSGGEVQPNLLNGQSGPFTDSRSSHSVFGGGDIQLPAFLGVWPSVVIGGQYSRTSLHLVFDEPTGNPIAGGTAIVNRFASIDRIVATTARAGVLVTPSTLVYGRAGPATMEFTANPTYFNAVNPASGAGTFNVKSEQVGGGFETFLTDHVALRVEGLVTRARQLIVLNGIFPGDTSLRPTVKTASVGLLAKF